MNLWLDDVRDCPFVGPWAIAKNYEEAVEILSTHDIEQAWLDHDLAYEHYGHTPESEYKEKTGYDVVLWMEENNKWPTETCMVHSMNPEGSKRMCEVIAKHYGNSLNPRRHYLNYMRLMGGR